MVTRQSSLPSWNTSGKPEGKKGRPKKTPSKLRRDAKRRTDTPKRRLDQQNVGREGDGENVRGVGEGVSDSPIPQLDGGGGEINRKNKFSKLQCKVEKYKSTIVQKIQKVQKVQKYKKYKNSKNPKKI